MITIDNQSIRIVQPVDMTALREVVLDEDGHIRELSAAEWAKFPWDDVRTFMHEYPVSVLPTTELLDVLDDLTCDYRPSRLGRGAEALDDRDLDRIFVWDNA